MDGRAIGPDYTLELVAIRTIVAGDELFISYIDETLPYRERQAQLAKGYQFDCRCPRCLSDALA